MKRVFNHLLGLNNLRKFCGNAAIFKYAKNNFKLEILDKPKQGRILVLAPHPDDDVFGCGGSLAMHAKQGDKVKIIYFAGNVAKISQISNLKSQNYGARSIDRRKNNQVYSSNPSVNLGINSVRSSQPSVSNNIGVVRSKEAMEAAKVLKVSDIEFWGLADNKFTADKENVERLRKVIGSYKPEIIYCPSFTDANPDHYEVGKMLYSVVARSRQATKQSIKEIAASRRTSALAMTDLSILLYEVWTPIYANRLVRIASVIEQKKAAIKCHQSQLSDHSYFDAIIGLNQYRAGMFNAGKYAEAFTEMSAELYVKLFEKYRLK